MHRVRGCSMGDLCQQEYTVISYSYRPIQTAYLWIICETNHIIFLVFLLAWYSVGEAKANLFGRRRCQQAVKWRELITL